MAYESPIENYKPVQHENQRHRLTDPLCREWPTESPIRIYKPVQPIKFQGAFPKAIHCEDPYVAQVVIQRLPIQMVIR